MNELVFRGENGVAMTNSYMVAETFGKAHYNVLRDIDSLNCSDCFRKLNFEFMLSIRELPNGGSREERYCQMTRDGFTILAMGYTGKKAMAFKEKYIEAFNRMEQMLRQGAAPMADNGRLLSLEKEVDLLKQELELKDKLMSLQQERHRLQVERLQLATPTTPVTEYVEQPAKHPVQTAISFPTEEQKEEPVDEEYTAFTAFANLFFGNPDNLGHPVSIRESTISWMLHRGMSTTHKEVAGTVLHFRHLMVRYCEEHGIGIGNKYMLRCATDLKKGLFRCQHPTSEFRYGKLALPRKRAWRRSTTHQCYIFYTDGMKWHTDSDNRPKAGDASGLLPTDVVTINRGRV